MKLKMGLEYFDKSSSFELKLFFQRPLENFLWTLRTCSRYLKGFSNLENCVSKQIVTTRHTKRIIWQEKQKNWDFEKWSSKCGWNILIFLSIFGVGTQFFWPRNSRGHVLSPNKCHHVLPRILFDLRIHFGDIPSTIHKFFQEKRQGGWEKGMFPPFPGLLTMWPFTS